MKYIVQRQLTVTNAIKQNEWVCRLRVRLDQTVSSIIELPKSGKSILRSKNTHTINILWSPNEITPRPMLHEKYMNNTRVYVPEDVKVMANGFTSKKQNAKMGWQ